MGKRLLSIEVQEGLDVYVANGKAPRRRFEASCLPLSGTDLLRLSDERRGTDWSVAPSGRSAKDIDPTALLHLRTLLGRSRNAPAESATASTTDLLAMLSLSDVNGFLTRAGELLLCSPWCSTLTTYSCTNTGRLQEETFVRGVAGRHRS